MPIRMDDGVSVLCFLNIRGQFGAERFADLIVVRIVDQIMQLVGIIVSVKQILVHIIIAVRDRFSERVAVMVGVKPRSHIQHFLNMGGVHTVLPALGTDSARQFRFADLIEYTIIPAVAAHQLMERRFLERVGSRDAGHLQDGGREVDQADRLGLRDTASEIVSSFNDERDAETGIKTLAFMLAVHGLEVIAMVAAVYDNSVIIDALLAQRVDQPSNVLIQRMAAANVVRIAAVVPVSFVHTVLQCSCAVK